MANEQKTLRDLIEEYQGKFAIVSLAGGESKEGQITKVHADAFALEATDAEHLIAIRAVACITFSGHAPDSKKTVGYQR